MPKFVAVHKWTRETNIACIKELIIGFTAMLKGEVPKDIILHYTWSRLDDPYGVFCFWEAPSKEALVKLFEKYLPTLLKYTEFVPVLQMYPPTVEYELSLLQAIRDMSSK